MHINRGKEKRKALKGPGCRVTHKLQWEKEVRKSRSGVEHYSYRAKVVPVTI